MGENQERAAGGRPPGGSWADGVWAAWMQRPFTRPTRARRGAGRRLWPVALCAVAGACGQPAVNSSVSVFSSSPAAGPPQAAPGPTAPSELAVAPGAGVPRSARPARLDVVLRVLHVQIPHAHADQAAALWNHVREDVLDAARQVLLRQNGVRVGVGHGYGWDAVKATLDAVAGVTVASLEPVRLPEEYPLALELDSRPREQTIFYVAEDGVLTGATWPASRNVLRVSFALNLEDPERVRLTVVPEVRQRLEGFRWLRSATGITQVPNYGGRTFAAAGFVVDLAPGEFVVLAPSERADLYGLVGGAFLARVQDDQRWDSYVFLRADVQHVARGH